MDFDELLISTVAQWGKDCIECADTLRRYSDIKPNEINVKRVTLCTGVTIGVNKYDLMNELRMNTIKICFTNLSDISKMISCLNIDCPNIFVERIWSECERLYKNWDMYFHDYKERLYDML